MVNRSRSGCWGTQENRRRAIDSRTQHQRGAFVALAACAVIAALAGTAGAVLPPERTSNLYVSNFNGDNIVVYDPSGKYMRALNPTGLDGARGIVFDTNGRFYVASQNTDEVFVFDENEQLVTKFADVSLNGPTGMALSGSNLLYVASYNNDQVVVFDLAGNFMRTFTGGGMNGPNCVAFDRRGTSTCRVR